jgi:hypothetical protein
MVQLDAHDRSEKYAAIAWLTQMIRRYQADAIVEVGEVWVSSLGGLEEGRLPSEDPKRQEALAVSVATSDGPHHVFTTPFRRTAFGSVRFGQTEANESMDPTYLTPIFEVWNLPLPGSDKGENPEG